MKRKSCPDEPGTAIIIYLEYDERMAKRSKRVHTTHTVVYKTFMWGTASGLVTGYTLSSF